MYHLQGGLDLTVTREGGRLYVQPTGQPRSEIFATSPDEFFSREVDASLTFHRGPDGRATDLVLHHNGRNLPGPRVP